MNKLESLVSKMHFERPESLYALEGYWFVLQAVEFVIAALPKRRHITAQELLRGSFQFAVQEYGPMAYSVWKYWGILAAKDFGNIVFDLVNAELLAKQPDDNLRDFDLDWNLETCLREASKSQEKEEK